MYMINHMYKHSHKDIGRALPENIWTGSSPVGRWILFFFFYWSGVDLQCFWLLAKWFSYTYVHVCILFQILLLYRLLQGVKSWPLAIQKALVVYLFYRQSYVSVHLEFQICPFPWRWLLQGGFFNLHPDWGLYFLLTETCWHFGNSHEDDGSALAPVVRTLLSLCRDPVQFLVGELRPLKPSRQGPQKMTNNLNPMATNHTNFATVCDDVGTQGMKRLKRKLAEIQQKALNMYCQRWFHLFLRMPLSS